ncbi:MAG: SsrA-binding protein, partial [Bdellovibrionaceae bacterium]|nr:SsrA-binding protein [Pseudobdellovibrionaceae bacterium]
MSIKIIAINKKASFQYELKEKFQAGLVLLGSEVKSLRKGSCQLKDSYIFFIRQEAFLQKAHISPYKKALNGGHNPERKRKLLLNKKELN